ncbi:MAG TPA: DUF6065 family protein [Micromonosporaceae bacterium]|jgi:hypothetical protein
MATAGLEPLRVEIYTIYPDVRSPERASATVRGSLPSRAVQHCPPVSAASGFGWYVYPPADFALRWDGRESEWSLLAENEPTQWRSLAGGHDAQLPDVKTYLADAPERFRKDMDILRRFDGGFPFVDADPRAGNMIEVTTGTVARTSTGWCLLARPVPNWPDTGGVQILDGLVETDWYRSTIPTILRLTEPGRTVRFYRDIPIMALQPVHRSTFEAVGSTPLTVGRGLHDWPDDIWAEYVHMRRERDDPTRRSAYRREQRRRARETAGYRPVIADDSAPDESAPGGSAPDATKA